MLGAVTVALAGSARVAARGKGSFEDLAGGLDDSDSGTTYEYSYEYDTQHANARVVCTSEGWASTYSSFMDSYISAGAAPPCPPAVHACAARVRLPACVSPAPTC